MSKALPVPDDFKENARLSNAELKSRYGVGDKTLAKWRKKLGIVVKPASNAGPAPAPSDFRDTALGKGNEWLMDHYGVGKNTITRWRQEAGAPPTARVNWGQRTHNLPRFQARSTADLACSFLQKRFRPVYDRKVEDKKLAGRWVVGRQEMSRDEMIEFAIEKGFEIDPEFA